MIEIKHSVLLNIFLQQSVDIILVKKYDYYNQFVRCFKHIELEFIPNKDSLFEIDHIEFLLTKVKYNNDTKLNTLCLTPTYNSGSSVYYTIFEQLDHFKFLKKSYGLYFLTKDLLEIDGDKFVAFADDMFVGLCKLDDNNVIDDVNNDCIYTFKFNILNYSEKFFYEHDVTLLERNFTNFNFKSNIK